MIEAMLWLLGLGALCIIVPVVVVAIRERRKREK
jgi:hypothetical protein